MKSAALLQFRRWFDDAQAISIPQPNAMSLATVATDGKPAVRMVLLSSFDERGFVFHTNYLSHKGQHITTMPWGALALWWEPLGRQVRIEGRIEKTSAVESDTYFASRPRGSQLGAWASNQSQLISNRADLESRLRELELYYRDQPVPRPPHWGGYRVIPTRIEFWISRDNRLHDRQLYEETMDGVWRHYLLAP